MPVCRRPRLLAPLWRSGHGRFTACWRTAADELARALENFDDVGAQAALDDSSRVSRSTSWCVTCSSRICTRSGSGGQRGELSVGQEHFISNVFRGRLLALARGWDRGRRPARCSRKRRRRPARPPLLLFGVVLRTHGWRITFLGADTPVASLAETVRAIAPDVVVVTGTVQGVLEPLVEQLREVARGARLYLAGPAADDGLARQANAIHLDGDLVDATSRVGRAA